MPSRKAAPALALLLACGPAAGIGFAPPDVLVGDAPAEDYAFADVDGDGRLDLAMVVGREIDPDLDLRMLTLEVRFQQADGAFGPPVSHDIDPMWVHTGGQRLALGDLDGDGDLDVAVDTLDESRIHLLRNDGAAFTTSDVLYTSDLGRNGDLHMVDANGDGNLDVVMGGGPSAQLLFGDGQAGLLGWSSMALRDRTDALHFADMTGDGRPDLVYATADGGVHMHEHEGPWFSATIRTLAWTGRRASPPALELADFNVDGRIDLLVDGRQWAWTPLTIHLQQPDGRFPNRPARYVFAPLGDIVATDMDLDGRPDLLVRHRDQAHASLLTGRGDGRFAPALVVPIDDAAAATWEVNGDGRIDYVGTAPDGSLFAQYAVDATVGPDLDLSLVLAPEGATVRIVNAGNLASTGFAVLVDIRARTGTLSAGGVPAGCVDLGSGGAIALWCDLPALAPGAVDQLAIPYALARPADLVTGVATVESAAPDLRPGNDSALARIYISAASPAMPGANRGHVPCWWGGKAACW